MTWISFGSSRYQILMAVSLAVVLGAMSYNQYEDSKRQERVLSSASAEIEKIESEGSDLLDDELLQQLRQTGDEAANRVFRYRLLAGITSLFAVVWIILAIVYSVSARKRANSDPTA